MESGDRIETGRTGGGSKELAELPKTAAEVPEKYLSVGVATEKQPLVASRMHPYQGSNPKSRCMGQRSNHWPTWPGLLLFIFNVAPRKCSMSLAFCLYWTVLAWLPSFGHSYPSFPSFPWPGLQPSDQSEETRSLPRAAPPETSLFPIAPGTYFCQSTSHTGADFSPLLAGLVSSRRADAC